VEGVLRIEVAQIALRDPDIGRDAWKQMVQRTDVPAQRRILPARGNATDDRRAGSSETARYRDQRIERLVKDVLADADAKLPFVGQVHLVSGVEAVIIRHEMIVVAGMLGVAQETQARRRQLR